MTVAIGAVALAGGGAGDAELGACCVLVWLLLAGLAISGRLSPAGLTGPLVLLLGLFAVLTGWTAASIGWAGDDGAAFTDVVRALLYLGVLLLVALSARPGGASAWLVGVAGGGALVAILAVSSRVLGLDADQDVSLALPVAAERLSFPLGYWNGLGYLMAMTLPALAWVAGAAPLRVSRVAVALSVPVAAAIFLTSSRGAFAAAIVGLALAGALAADRTRMLRAATAAVPAWLGVIAAAAALRDDLLAGAGLSGPGLLFGGAIVLGAALAQLAFARLAGRKGRTSAPLSRLGRWRIVIALVAVAAAVAAIGPSAFLGEFRTQSAGDEREAAAALVSGSGRSNFWGAALDAFAEDPLRGTGAGGYRNYWNNNGDLAVAVVNAHSAPLETLAELGLVGGIALLGALAMPLVGARRLWAHADPSARGAIGAALGVLVAGLIGIAIDWTWQLPAALAPMLIVLVLLSGASLKPRGWGGALLVDPRIPGYEPREGPQFHRPVLLAGAATLAGIAAVWAGAVLALGSVQLERSGERLAQGDLQGAAEAARAAEAIVPWSPEPPLQLAAVEQVGKNYEAAAERAREAIRMSPRDYRPWLVLSSVSGALGNQDLAFRYFGRATMLARLVLRRTDARFGLR
ncbi:MAG TPA: O-antigen ligase family protein [Solirubrobacterales bacterium]|nr:O-antigen ligase family protein [Solirubrobacterales bacterium]